MADYIRNRIDNVVTVRSIVTVLHMDLHNKLCIGESHNFPEIFYVEQGRTFYVLDGKTMMLDAGTMVICAPNTFHGDTVRRIPGGIVGIISFETDSDSLYSLYDRPILLNSRQREQLETMIAKGQTLFEPAKQQSGVFSMIPVQGADPRELQKLKNSLELFLLNVSQSIENSIEKTTGANQEQHYRQQMDVLTTYLSDHLEQNLTLTQIETALGFSESSLRRLVRRYKSCSPLAYFQELKIREAKNLIRNSSLNITEIAEHLGYSSVQYFSYIFRKKTGSSPTDYAKNSK